MCFLNSPMPSVTGTLNYDLLAIDLDGTLLDRAGKVSRANREALDAARDSGMKIAVCTGRGLCECREALDAIAQVDPVVVAGGSIVACPRTEQTLHRFAIEPRIVNAAVERVLHHGFPALVFKDRLSAGYDYLVVVGPRRFELDPVTRWWFGAMSVKARYVESIQQDEHPEHTVRFGACGLSGEMAVVARDLAGLFGEEAAMHHFPAVVAPEHASRLGDDSLHVLEVFGAQANKWNAVKVVADRHGVSTDRIAAIGDQINDVAMIAGARLGIAMGNAVPQVREVARRVTHTNEEDGVAHAVRKILNGEW